MAEILHHQRCINPVNNGIFIISTGQPSTVWLWGHICLEVILRLMTPHQADWWLEEHGLIMEKPDPLPPGTWASNVISFNYSSFLGRFFSWVFAGGWHTHTHKTLSCSIVIIHWCLLLPSSSMFDSLCITVPCSDHIHVRPIFADALMPPAPSSSSLIINH